MTIGCCCISVIRLDDTRDSVPPAIAFLAGWIAARGTWFGRAVVVGVAVLLLAAFPYAAAGAATARALTG